MKENNLWSDLKWRGLIYDATPDLEKQISDGVTLYLGIDPTGDSLHIGHLLGVSLLRRFRESGHKVIVIMGGGTAVIGDPSGKDKERPVVSKEKIESNKKKIKEQLGNFLDFDGKEVKMVDNAEWLEETRLIDFLREVGKNMPVSSMLSKESVKTRLEREQGMSYAEFSYQLLQSYDYWKLFDEYGCNLQVGGSDQWGNILQGVDLIRRKEEEQVHGLAYPLIVDPSTGKKFGKTADGAAIWLDEKKTHPFDLYQFLMNASDELAEDLIKYYSFKDREEIEEIIASWRGEEHKRLLQRELAFEITQIVHGEKTADKVKKISQVLYDKGKDKLEEGDFEMLEEVLGTVEVGDEEVDMVEVLVETELASSNSEARRLIKQDAVSINWYTDRHGLIKKGKRDYGVVKKNK